MESLCVSNSRGKSDRGGGGGRGWSGIGRRRGVALKTGNSVRVWSSRRPEVSSWFLVSSEKRHDRGCFVVFSAVLLKEGIFCG